MRKYLLLPVLICALTGLNAQHHQHQHPEKKKNPPKEIPDTTKKQDRDQHHHHQEQKNDEHEEHEMGNMSHAFSLNLPMTRNGSGTAWLPDASPMFGYMKHTKHWMWMGHGNIFLRYNHQDFTNKGTRGNKQWDAPNWLMFMGQRRVGERGLFRFNTMFSLDAAVTGAKGYPLLFQSGETYAGSPLVDRQHPHDLFSELSVSYAHAFNQEVDAFIYLGYPGEPALGPVAFMHRPSAMYNPDAPLSHHWIDATHITYGVATAGVRLDKFKIEASSFTGREPDENRFDLDKPRFDSWSGRISFAPDKNLSFQVSHALLKNPEILHPGNINRTTASAIFSKVLPNGSWINVTTAWGVNKRDEHEGEDALLLEGAWNLNKLAVYGRYEYVQKSTDELDLDEAEFGEHVLYPVNAFTVGVNYDLIEYVKTRLSIGGQYTIYEADDRLNTLYGDKPMAFEVYLRIYPGLMNPPK